MTADRTQPTTSRTRPSGSPVACRGGCFDRDYAGGGTTVRCPDGGPLLYAYHGENHTDPSGRTWPGPDRGWTGIGLARWDAAAERFVRLGQIIGLEASNRWSGAPDDMRTEQAPPLSSQGAMVVAPDGRTVRLYYTDRAASVGRPLRSGRAIAVASVRFDDLCREAAIGRLAPWRKYRHRGFDTAALSADGTGGPFSPLVSPVESNPTVAVIGRRWYMTTDAGHQEIRLRVSADGLRWSAPRTIVTAADDGLVLYPSIVADRGHAYVLYVRTRLDDSERRQDTRLERIVLAV